MSSGLRVLIVAVVCFVVVASAGHIRKSAPVRRQHPQFTCSQQAAMCLMPLSMAMAMVPKDVLMEQIRQEGINDVCTEAVSVKECIESALNECGDDEEVPEQLQQAFAITTGLITFVCEEQINAINGDRQCLFSDALMSATERRCGQGSGQICQVVEDSECGIALFEERCNNAELANEFRSFLQRLEQQSNCDTVVSMKWRELVDLARRR